MKKLVIFGTATTGELAHFYFTTDSEYKVVAFCANEEYIKTDSFCGLPLVPFSKVANLYPPSEHEFFVAVGHMQGNEVRKSTYLAAKAAGYKMASYISSKATIASNVKIGEHCWIYEHSFIYPFAQIMDNVTVTGALVAHHCIIRDHVFVAGGVTMGGCVDIGEQSFIGMNATIRDNIKIESKCLVGAGALILRNTQPESVYIGETTKSSRLSFDNYFRLSSR